MTRHTRRLGLTAIELMVSLAVVGVIVGSVLTASLSSTRLAETSISDTVLDNKLGGTMTRLVSELTDIVGSETIADLSPFAAASAIDFRISLGWGGGPVLGPPMLLAWEMEEGELDNGIDDDRDGLVDEGVVVRTENPGMADEVRVVLVRGVSEYLEGEVPNLVDDNGNGVTDERGLCFTLESGLLTIWLTVQKSFPDGAVAERTLETSILLRN